LTAAERVVGVIAEYNPFHNGHLYHLKRSLELTGAGVCVAVMSGDFVQRGEPALLDKWRRSAVAVKNGLDLVVELPFLYAAGSAEYFASGAVRLLDAMGFVTHLAFGCEAGELAPLAEAARVLAAEPRGFKDGLRAALKEGLSFPRARAEALRREAGDAAAELLDRPNHIPAVEYIKQLILTGSRIEPVAIRRAGAGYFEADPRAGIAGASAIRTMFLSDEKSEREEALRYLPYPADMPAALQSLDRYFTIIAAAARMKSRDELHEIISASEGLENRLKRALDRAFDMPSLIAAVKTGRYTETRVRRFLLHVLFGITRERFAALDAAWPGYLRVLALSEKGGALLRRVKTRAEIPIITNPNKQRVPSPASEILDLDILAADIYNLVGAGAMRERSDYRMRPFVLCARGLNNNIYK
jgi:predicted nucleotidyltransferase